MATRLRDVKIEETFVVSSISEDAILGMPFLAAHNCTMDFGRPVLTINGRELTCTDRHGWLLASRVQICWGVTISPETETNILCRLTSRNHCPIGMVEGDTDQVL